MKAFLKAFVVLLAIQPNPVEPSTAALEGALEHWADHCAACHANDGSGDTEIGRSFYPPSPDMRGPRTQALKDGELFAIIAKPKKRDSFSKV